MDFSKRYAKLNPAQKKAVDTIDGPVMVVAGPGTGKTELLSLRVANILQQTDTLPENILCLTFTDNAANEMRSRLVGIIGKDAHKVAVHTFHSFGAEAINQNEEFFYQGANFQVADELTKYQILEEIFDELEFDNPLATRIGDNYIHIGHIKNIVSEIKRSGLTGEELLKVLDDNDLAMDRTEKLLQPVFADRISKKTIPLFASAVEKIKKLGTPEAYFGTIQNLQTLIIHSLEAALEESLNTHPTKPITAWKGNWLEKNSNNQFVFKSRKRQDKLRLVKQIYDSYLKKLYEKRLYDFDDMILQLVHGLEINDELRLNLQEKYLYIMVDEFQDTNLAQMRILHTLSNTPHGDDPNLFVVGDDDQAIYSFQGADISQVLDFRESYPNTKTIVLKENYRSTDKVIGVGRNIIVQGEDRLENRYKELDKQLNASGNHQPGRIELKEFGSIEFEQWGIVKDIQARINGGQNPSSIAVLTRKHKDIKALLPFFASLKIAVNYDKEDDILDHPAVSFIEKLARVVVGLSRSMHNEVNGILPELLTHPAWNISHKKLWEISSQAYKNHKKWLDVLLEDTELEPIFSWLTVLATSCPHTPLEIMIGRMIGNPQEPNSPVYEYFFKDKIEKDPTSYIDCLEALRLIREKTISHYMDSSPTLSDFVDFIDTTRLAKVPIGRISKKNLGGEGVNLLTAHSAKGLEFQTVYICNLVESVWGKKSKSKPRAINYPENLPLKPAGENDDERLRLFYVAITRAQQDLIMSYSKLDAENRQNMMLGSLAELDYKPIIMELPGQPDQISVAETAWYRPLIESVQKPDLKQLVRSKLDDYQLSATHLGNFLDVTKGGPEAFLINNILQFPTPKSANAIYGTAMHEALYLAHLHFSSSGQKQPEEDIITKFNLSLSRQHLSERDLKIYSERGSQALRRFLNENYESFSQKQKAELNFKWQQAVLGEAHLSGKLDLVDINEEDKTIVVTDYKTGKPSASWKGKSDYEKIKLHKYEQQLAFYKLLIENSRDFSKYEVKKGVVQFVEPDSDSGKIIKLETDFSNFDFDKFTRLIQVVWGKIKNLDMPDTSGYDQEKLKGIEQFEQDLLAGKS